jgi:beta-xylosidase
MAEITAAQASLRSASEAAGLQSIDIGELRACLSGVSSAVNALQSSDLPGAVNAIDAASPTCLSLDGSSGPAYPFNFPDPSVLTVGSHQYYGFATNSAAGNVQVIQSSDLGHWTTLGDALPHLAIWAQPNNIWAPSALRLGTSYLLYYSADFAATKEQCLSVAVATQPQGPYIDSTTWPIECQLDLGGSLDPNPFVDANGTPYLTWKSQGTASQPPAIWSQQLTPDGTALAAGAPSVLLTPSQPWQDGVVEGPDMAVSGGQYRLFYSANSWKTSAYAIGEADCSGPSGPCTESSDQPLLTSQSAFIGPGGPATFTDAQGTLWMAFHAWLPGAIGFPNSRLLFLRPVTVTAVGAAIGP